MMTINNKTERNDLKTSGTMFQISVERVFGEVENY